MAASALEEKIIKIRQQNEEIRRRHEEVELDKKNAAKSNALVQMVPSTDWPERKEPPEFSNPPRPKPKPAKEKSEYISHTGEGKKAHTFAQGEGPPPDPKYNFLADAEREETDVELPRENLGNRAHNKPTRGNFKKRGVGRENTQRDYKFHKGSHKDEGQPGYDAWRAERDRIDEDRISRQRTAEGNWRREWDNDKMHVVDDVMKAGMRNTLGDYAKKDHKDFERKYYANGSEHTNYNRGGGQRPHRGAGPKNFYNNYDNRSHNNYENRSHNNFESRSHNNYDQHRHSLPASNKVPLSPNAIDERTVIATDKSIKVTLNQNNSGKAPVMSVKVNSPSIAGTGRVGPRQRTRVTYSHSDAEVTVPEAESFSRQKSFEDKSKGGYFNNQKSSNIKRTQSLKKTGSKSPYLPRKEIAEEDSTANLQKPYSASKSPRPVKKFTKPVKYNSANKPQFNKKEGNAENIVEDSNLEGTNVNDHSADKDIVDSELKNLEDQEVENVDSLQLSKTASSETEDSEVFLEETDSNDQLMNQQEEHENTSIEKTLVEEVVEYVTKENTDENPASDEICCLQESNNLLDDLQDKCDLSPDRSDVKEAEVTRADCASNESNNLSDDKLSDNALNKDDEECQSTSQLNESSINDSCDNIKEDGTDKQEFTDTTSDKHSSETESSSVIDAIESDNVVPSVEVVNKTHESPDAHARKHTEVDKINANDANLKDTLNVANDESLRDKNESQNKTVVDKETKEEQGEVTQESKE